MKNILVIVDKFYPVPSSTGYCAYRIVEELKKTYEVSVLTIYGEEDNEVYSINRKTIHRSFLTKYFGLMEDPQVVKQLVARADEICSDKNIDVVLTFYQPIETIVAGYKIAHKNKIIHIPCFFDIVDTSIKTSKIKKKYIDIKFRVFYKRLLQKNSFLYLKYYQIYFDKMVGKRRVYKPIPIGIPTLKKSEICNKKQGENTNINLVYAGSFYSDIRNPAVLLDLMKSIIGTNVILHLYSWDCEEIVEKYRSIYGQNLMIHGRVTHDEIDEVMNDADVLINFSNDCVLQVPGKIFEYYSMCKPVINVIQRCDDAGIADYNQYPLSINVKVYEEQDLDMLNLIMATHNKTIDFDIVKELFEDSTPEYVCKCIIDIIGE